VDGAVFFAGCGVVMTVSAGSLLSTGCGLADVMVVAEVGAVVGEATDGGDTGDGICGVARTAMVTPKRIVPATATTHVIVVRKPSRRGTRTVAFCCVFGFSRVDAGGGAGACALRPE
jgi:hypothetical protein